MVRHGGALWAQHEHVANDLSLGERAADRLKAAFGSWGFLIGLNALIVLWCALNWLHVAHFDPYPFIALNLVLSWLAAQQGGALQIAANRGDRLTAEVALHTQKNTDKLIAINEQQLVILTELRELRAQLQTGSTADVPGRGGAGRNPAEAGLDADGHMVPPPVVDPPVQDGAS